jgi:hypothetical protein
MCSVGRGRDKGGRERAMMAFLQLI